MILPSMSYREIDDFFRQEIKSIPRRVENSARIFASLAKKTRQYPLTRVFSVRTRNLTDIFLVFSITKRSQWNHPQLCYYTIFRYVSGMYAISLDTPDGVACIYTAHFFQRYRERVVKDPNLGVNDLIKRFMIRNRDIMWHKNAASFSSAYLKYEKDGIPQKAARIEEGNCFMEQISSQVFLFKTILSDDNLVNSQVQAFDELERMREAPQ